MMAASSSASCGGMGGELPPASNSDFSVVSDPTWSSVGFDLAVSCIGSILERSRRKTTGALLFRARRSRASFATKMAKEPAVDALPDRADVLRGEQPIPCVDVVLRVRATIDAEVVPEPAAQGRLRCEAGTGAPLSASSSSVCNVAGFPQTGNCLNVLHGSSAASSSRGRPDGGRASNTGAADYYSASPSPFQR
jgi:hypothetical protein